MTDKNVLRPQLWKPRTVEETISVYADWADTYDKEVTERGYKTPARLADVLAKFADKQSLVLDFGCGTGISGAALKTLGFEHLHGTDITAEMLDKATASGLYEKTWLSTAGDMDFEQGSYEVIVAVGVVSLGAAPPETLSALIDKLGIGGYLAFSYNGPTLEDGSYVKALDDEIASGRVECLFRKNGPHLEDVGMNSDIIVLRRK